MLKKTPLSGAYLAKNPILLSLLFLIDFFTWPLKRKSKKKFGLQNPPQKILLSNLGHLGDVVIATSVLPVLKKAFPEAEIGFLVSSYSQQVVKEHPLINRIYLLDHWKLNREKISLLQKIKKYWSMKRKALKEIKQDKYDLAIDLYFYFPNSIPLLWKAKIPQRIGFQSGGFKNLLTDFCPFENKNHYVSQYYLDLLKKIAVPSVYFSYLKVCLKKPQVDCDKMLPLEFWKKGFLILHMGAGSELKKWPQEKWHKLAGRLIDQGYLLAFTGKGKEEKAAIFNITKNFSQTVNLCDQLDFEKLQFLVKNSLAVICSDSLVSHLAGAYNVPAVILFAGLNNYHHWTPQDTFAKPLVKQVACLPCFAKKGCSKMNGKKNMTVEITVEEVEESLNLILDQKQKLKQNIKSAKQLLQDTLSK